MTGEEVHVYDCLDEEPCGVLLRLEGFTFESSVELTASGRLEGWIMVRVPKRFARVLGMIAH